MKNLLTLLVITLLIGTLTSQSQIAVKSFRKLDSDLTARIEAPKKDQNGDICAIIKVETTQTGFTWDSDGLGIVAVVPKVGEYWIYVPWGAKRLTIKHPQLGILREYQYTVPIEKATVYEMKLVTGSVKIIVDETILGYYVIITPEPADASIFIDEVLVKKGTYQAKLKPGSYNYRVQDPLYKTEVGKFELTNKKEVLNIKLKPNFGFISVATLPESGASVFIDDIKLTQPTPCTSDSLLVGEHKVRVEREMYQPEEKRIKVEAEKTSPVNLTLIPTFAEVAFNLPPEASLFLNGEKVATGNWKTRLTKGVYTVEARRDKHITAKKDIDVVEGENQIIDLQPILIYGSLDVETNPPGATITINGLEMGKTPESFNTLLIGDYEIKLDRPDYKSLIKNVSVSEGKNTIVKETLSKIALPKREIDQTVQRMNVSKTMPYKQLPQMSYSKEYYKYKKSKTIWLVSALVTGAAGTFTYLQAGSTYETYKTTAGNEATDLIKKVDMYNLVSPIAFGIAGFSVLEFILKSGKQKKAKSKSNGQSLNFYPVPIKNGAGVGLAVQF